jgi:hypothetical protein
MRISILHSQEQHVTYFVTLNVVEAITLGKVLGDGTLTTSGWSSDYQDVVVARDGHGGRDGISQRGC